MADSQQTGSGLAPNIASMLCYVCSFITGIVFLVLEKDNKEVRYHAWQAIFFGIAAMVLHFALTIIRFFLISISLSLGSIVGLLSSLLGLAIFILWIVCMLKAYQGERYKLPIIGDLAEKQASK